MSGRSSLTLRVVPEKPERLRMGLTDDRPPNVPAWGVLSQPPNARPWAHLRQLVDRL